MLYWIYIIGSSNLWAIVACKQGDKSMNKHIEKVISNLIEEMEKTNKLPWVQQQVQMRVSNYVTGHEYSILNTIILSCFSRGRGYDCPYWAGFNQIKSIGGIVRKGSRATIISRAVQGYKTTVENNQNKDVEKEDEQKKVKSYNYLIGCPVFNMTQVDGIDWKTEIIGNRINNEHIETLDLLIKDYQKRNPKLRINESWGSGSSYFPDLDLIRISKITQFNKPEDYYDDIFHEIGHSTRIKSRLGFGDSYSTIAMKERSIEEVAVTIASMYILAKYGIEINYENNSTYINEWLKWMKSKKTQFISCICLADRIYKYILSGEENQGKKEEIQVA